MYMAAPGDVYERELKYLLTGDQDAVAKMVKTCSDQETEAYCSMIDHPFMVIRAAGSLGVDLVALRWDFSFPVEVKSSDSDVLYLSKSERLREQAARMLDECDRCHIIPIYAYRLKGVHGDPWRIFTLPSQSELVGWAQLLKQQIPKVEITKSGNFVLRWKEGMKLSDLLYFVGHAEARGEETVHETAVYEEN